MTLTPQDEAENERLKLYITPESCAVVSEAVAHLSTAVPLEFRETWARTLLVHLGQAGLLLPPGGTSYPKTLRRNGKKFYRTVTTWADGSQLFGPWIEGDVPALSGTGEDKGLSHGRATV